MTGSTLHLTIEQHIIVDITTQTTIGGCGRKQTSITCGQRICIIKRDGVVGAQIITSHSTNPERRIDEIGTGSDPAEIFQGNSAVMTAET